MLAIASLVCSIVGIFTCIGAPAGIVLGHLARSQIRQTREAGDGLAVGGLWVGYLVTVSCVLAVLFYAVWFFWIVTSGTNS
ncbi:DUF4190 domain-containing protein [Actinoplanes philippinensis]|uniref:DUF4190 domain-containing protein n=1 Tax=Actinoplanes philippinensis TaxID=35752 RepID=UPI0015A5178F|nr:DUF4190 domain-containing protein [Actinoplanes philippinensis]